MSDEIPPPEIPGAQVPPPNQTPPNIPAPPPATALVVKGEVKSERELALDRRETEVAGRESVTRDVENNLSDKERKLQEREAALRTTPTVPAPKKEKRKFLIRTLINTQPDNE